MEQKTIYDFIVKDKKGNDFDLSQYQGKVILVVNTASKCGLTPQFEGLEKLWKKYKDRGLQVIGFPCNQFNNQDSGTDEEIQAFCSLNYGVTFPIMKKIKVNGEEADPLFKWLKNEKKGLLRSAIKWNFTKFLINKEGKPVRRFSPITKPASLEKYIEEQLNA